MDWKVDKGKTTSIKTSVVLEADDMATTNIKIPVLWPEKPENPKGLISKFGFYEDEEKYILAFESKRFELLDNKQCDLLVFGLYINADNKTTTGKVEYPEGVDYQFGLGIKPRYIRLRYWVKDHPRAIPLPAYPNDYRGEFNGNVYYLAVKKRESIFVAAPFSPKFSIRITLGSTNRVNPQPKNSEGHESKTITVDTENKTNQFISYAFPGFPRKGRAGIIYKQGKTTIWNTWLERFGPDETIPVTTTTLKTLNFSAAKGESESLQLCVTTPKPLDDLKVSVSDLPGIQTRIEYVGFAKDYSNNKVQDIVYSGFEELKEKGKNNFVLLTVTIDRKVPAGSYEGHVYVTFNNKKPKIKLPFTVRVYNFELPEVPSFRCAFNLKGTYTNLHDRYKVSPGRISGFISLDLLKPGINENDGSLYINGWNEFDKKAARLLEKYPVFIWSPYFQLGSKNGKLSLAPHSIKNTHKDKEWLFSPNTGENEKIINPKDSHFQKYWPQFVQQVAKHLNDKGWLEKTIFILFDEPKQSLMEHVQTMSKLAKEAVKKINLKINLGVFLEYYNSDLINYIDTWIMIPWNYRQMIDKKIKFWIYNDPSWGSFISPATDIRTGFWSAFKYELGGFYLWHVAFWENTYEGKLVTPHDYLYYPSDSKIPYPSLRLTLIRDGIEDYEYLKLYKELLAQAKLKNHPEFANADALWREIKQAMPEVNQENKMIFPIDSIEDLSKLRNKMAEQIEKLNNTIDRKTLWEIFWNFWNKNFPIPKLKFPIPLKKIFHIRK